MTRYMVKDRSRHLDSNDHAYIMQDKAKKKFIVQLSKYGTVAYRADFIVEANTEDEAYEIAQEEASNELLEDKFEDEEEEIIEGWNYQTERAEEIIEDVD